nr:MAG TPA: hypothetical protein [Caudoviricetes sp.]
MRKIFLNTVAFFRFAGRIAIVENILTINRRKNFGRHQRNIREEPKTTNGFSR